MPISSVWHTTSTAAVYAFRRRDRLPSCSTYVRQVIGVRVTDPVDWTQSLHELAISAPQHPPGHHEMIGRIVNTAVLASACPRGMCPEKHALANTEQIV
jgi:hypothetical protein